MEITERDGLTVMGLEVTARWEDLWTEMPKAWKTLLARLEEIPHQASDRLVDVSLERRGDHYRQVIGAVVNRIERCPEGMTTIYIPPQRLVFHRHEGPVTGIADTFGEMLDWAREQGVETSDFKIDVGYTPEGTETRHDLYVGLTPQVAWQRL